MRVAHAQTGKFALYIECIQGVTEKSQFFKSAKAVIDLGSTPRACAAVQLRCGLAADALFLRALSGGRWARRQLLRDDQLCQRRAGRLCQGAATGHLAARVSKCVRVRARVSVSLPPPAAAASAASSSPASVSATASVSGFLSQSRVCCRGLGVRSYRTPVLLITGRHRAAGYAGQSRRRF
jgi:hypothetical protein